MPHPFRPFPGMSGSNENALANNMAELPGAYGGSQHFYGEYPWQSNDLTGGYQNMGPQVQIGGYQPDRMQTRFQPDYGPSQNPNGITGNTLTQPPSSLGQGGNRLQRLFHQQIAQRNRSRLQQHSDGSNFGGFSPGLAGISQGTFESAGNIGAFARSLASGGGGLGGAYSTAGGYVPGMGPAIVRVY